MVVEKWLDEMALLPITPFIRSSYPHLPRHPLSEHEGVGLTLRVSCCGINNQTALTQHLDLPNVFSQLRGVNLDREKLFDGLDVGRGMERGRGRRVGAAAGERHRDEELVGEVLAVNPRPADGRHGRDGCQVLAAPAFGDEPYLYDEIKN